MKIPVHDGVLEQVLYPLDALVTFPMADVRFRERGVILDKSRRTANDILYKLRRKRVKSKLRRIARHNDVEALSSDRFESADQCRGSMDALFRLGERETIATI